MVDAPRLSDAGAAAIVVTLPREIDMTNAERGLRRPECRLVETVDVAVHLSRAQV